MKPLRARLQEARKRLGIPWDVLERDYTPRGHNARFFLRTAKPRKRKSVSLKRNGTISYVSGSALQSKYIGP